MTHGAGITCSLSKPRAPCRRSNSASRTRSAEQTPPAPQDAARRVSSPHSMSCDHFSGKAGRCFAETVEGRDPPPERVGPADCEVGGRVLIPSVTTSSFGGVNTSTSKVRAMMTFWTSLRLFPAAPDTAGFIVAVCDLRMLLVVVKVGSSSSHFPERRRASVALIASFSSLTRSLIQSSMRARTSSYCWRMVSKRAYVQAAMRRQRQIRPYRSAFRAATSSEVSALPLSMGWLADASSKELSSSSGKDAV
mmetsp:Transcript_66667/g.156966  ORF Transcript_66667/g.156966 Transcript_66667/m.156966 type:complete len:250 (+) Transcript_66667:1063-1812(+)